jgi:cytoskeletal protein RodZ
MPTVGRTLASERARQRLELEDVARTTKISVRALKSIEADDFNQLPGLVFARNFVRQFAQCLQLDAGAMVEQFDREQSIPAPEFAIPRRETHHIHVPPIGDSRLGRLFDNNTVSAFVVFVLTLGVCAGAFAGFQYWRSHTTAPVKIASAGKAKRNPEPPPPKVETVAPAKAEATPTNAAQLDSPAVAASGAKVHVALSATEACWTRVTADGKILFAGLLAAGDSRLINATETVNVRAGNAGALAIKLNGNDVPPIGPKGQIRTVTLTLAGAQVRTPTPDPDFL